MNVMKIGTGEIICSYRHKEKYIYACGVKTMIFEE
jgi:hypothetical protein